MSRAVMPCNPCSMSSACRKNALATHDFVSGFPGGAHITEAGRLCVDQAVKDYQRRAALIYLRDSAIYIGKPTQKPTQHAPRKPRAKNPDHQSGVNANRLAFIGSLAPKINDLAVPEHPLTPSSDSDRHRGGGHPPTPATPPCIRVRTRRFESVRSAHPRTMTEARAI